MAGHEKKGKQLFVFLWRRREVRGLGKLNRVRMDALVFTTEICDNVERSWLVEEREITCKKDIDAQSCKKIVLIAEVRPGTGVVGGRTRLRCEE
jgi:hypothetical protein